MQEKELSGLTDKELLEKLKNMKSAPIANAILIGFLVGIIVYSSSGSSWGFFTLIPLFFAYKLIDNSKKK